LDDDSDVHRELPHLSGWQADMLQIGFVRVLGFARFDMPTIAGRMFHFATVRALLVRRMDAILAPGFLVAVF
jgi:hypothetical protein